MKETADMSGKSKNAVKYGAESRSVSLILCLLYANFAVLTLSASVIKLVSPGLIFLICSIATVVINLIMSHRYGNIAVLALFAVAAVATMSYQIHNVGVQAMFTGFGEYFNSFYTLFFGSVNTDFSTELSAAVTLIVIFAFFSFFFIDKLLSPVVLFLTNMIIFAVKSLIGDVSGLLYFILLMGTTLLATAWYVYLSGKREAVNKQNGFARSALFGGVMIAVALTVSYFLPVYKSGVSKHTDGLLSIGVLSKYSITDSADKFDSEDEIGGPIELNDSEIFRVTSDSRLKLMGEVKTDYNGKKWLPGTRNGLIYSGYESKDCMELLLNLQREGVKQTERHAVITPDTVKIATIFVPSRLRSMNFEQPVVSYIADDGTIAVKDYITYTYNVSFYDGGVYSDYGDIKDMLKKSHAGFYRELQNQNYSYTGEIGSVSVSELAEKADTVRQDCLDLPSNVSKRVRNLAGEITKDAKNDYEKVTAIKQYLRKYKYTLKPSSLPAGAEITDYFLFEGKEGYCTYFATAFSVLCRAEGIPTRYVEGYNSPAKIGDRDSKGMYNFEITNLNAHSWVQVYFEGVGWIDFEVTPPMDYSDSGEKVPEDAFATKDDMKGFDVAKKEDTVKQEGTTESTSEPEEEQVITTRPTQAPTRGSADTQKKDKDKPKSKSFNAVGTLAGIVIFAVIVLFAAYFVTAKCRRDRIAAARSGRNPRSATADCYRLIEGAGRLFGCGRTGSQTASEYIGLLCERFDIDGGKIAETIDRGLYGGEISANDIGRLIEFYNKLYDAGAASLKPFTRAVKIDLLHLG